MMTREVIARAPPPAFLFPNQRCQRPEPALPAPPFSARCRRRRLSSRPGFPCQSALSSFFLAAGSTGFEERSATAEAGSERKNHCGLPRGFPHRSVAIRLKDRKLYASDEKIKGLIQPLVVVAAPFPTGERRLYGPPFPVSIDLPKFLPHRRPKTLKAKELRPPPEGRCSRRHVADGGYLAFPTARARPNRPSPGIKRRSRRPAL